MMNGLNATVKDEHRKRLEVDHSAAEIEKRTSPAPSAQPQDPRLLAVVAWRECGMVSRRTLIRQGLKFCIQSMKCY